MEDAGIRPSRRQHRVGDYELVQMLFDGPGYQDWEAKRVALPRVVRRIRLYPVAAKAPGTRQTLVRAAQREFQILEGIEHPGILKAVEYTEHELGPPSSSSTTRTPSASTTSWPSAPSASTPTCASGS